MIEEAFEEELEPMAGLPEALPEGEQLLWQGQPTWWAMAKRVFHIRAVMVYFALLAVWRLAEAASLAEGLAGASALLIPFALVMGLLVLMAKGIANTSLYTITSKRIVLRVGVALTKSINLPFAQIASADIKHHGDGTADIVLTLSGKNRPAYLLLWPHVRPFAIGSIQPQLRGLAQAEKPAQILARALTQFHGGTASPAQTDSGQVAGTPATA